MAAQLSSFQFISRSLKEYSVHEYVKNAAIEDPKFRVNEEVKLSVYSRNGEKLAFLTNEGVKVIETEGHEEVFKINQPNLVDIDLSPRGNFISVWERQVKRSEGPMHNNLVIWNVATGKEVISFSQKSQNGWKVQWSENEQFCIRMVTNEVHVYHRDSMSKGTIFSKLQLEGLQAIRMSPGKSPCFAVFVPEKKAAPAFVRVYDLSNFHHPLAQKTFFKADKVQMMWNDLGTNIIVLTQTEVDKTGKSYYGETNLYYMATAGNYDCRVILDKEGPIHDIAWTPNSKEFMVIYGFMPAKVTLFDHRANKLHEFGTFPRNFARFNPQGRIICVAGFGNLAGAVDLWDRKTLTKIATLDASGSAFCEWSPDGRHLLTAILSPRLRVDNGFKVWHYTGVLVAKKEISELYQVDWKPVPVDRYPEIRNLSPPPVGLQHKELKLEIKKISTSGAYRPPHARGLATPDHYKRGDVDATENKESATASKTASKNKKKREAKKSKEDGEDETEVAPASSTVKSPTVKTEEEKRIKNIKKKITQIEDLKERRDKGEKLELTQLKKIESLSSLLQELSMLEK